MPIPLIVSTWSFGLRGNVQAWPALRDGGSSVDAVETISRVVDADPEVDSVGYGGLPDRDGTMTLDGAIMLSPSRCGGVCGVRRHLHPVSIARRVMEDTHHVLLAGDGADAFADACGLERRELLSDEAAATWRAWRQNPTVIDQGADRGYAPPRSPRSPRPVDTGAGGRLFQLGGTDAGTESGTDSGTESGTESGRDAGKDERRPAAGHDTISSLVIDTHGVMAGASSTSGMPFKLPGRVGDAPIIGHGLYVDPDAGGAVATGTGELVMGVCGSFLAVELMRRGAAPAEALHETLDRIRTQFVLEPEHQVAMIVMSPDGEWAADALRDGYRVSVTDETGDRVV